MEDPELEAIRFYSAFRFPLSPETRNTLRAVLPETAYTIRALLEEAVPFAVSPSKASTPVRGTPKVGTPIRKADRFAMTVTLSPEVRAKISAAKTTDELNDSMVEAMMEAAKGLQTSVTTFTRRIASERRRSMRASLGGAGTPGTPLATGSPLARTAPQFTPTGARDLTYEAESESEESRDDDSSYLLTSLDARGTDHVLGVLTNYEDEELCRGATVVTSGCYLSPASAARPATLPTEATAAASPSTLTPLRHAFAVGLTTSTPTVGEGIATPSAAVGDSGFMEVLSSPGEGAHTSTAASTRHGRPHTVGRERSVSKHPRVKGNWRARFTRKTGTVISSAAATEAHHHHHPSSPPARTQMALKRLAQLRAAEQHNTAHVHHQGVSATAAPPPRLDFGVSEEWSAVVGVAPALTPVKRRVDEREGEATSPSDDHTNAIDEMETTTTGQDDGEDNNQDPEDETETGSRQPLSARLRRGGEQAAELARRVSRAASDEVIAPASKRARRAVDQARRLNDENQRLVSNAMAGLKADLTRVKDVTAATLSQVTQSAQEGTRRAVSALMPQTDSAQVVKRMEEYNS